MFGENNYLAWQKFLQENLLLRRVGEFFAFYSIFLFGAYLIYLLFLPNGKNIFFLSLVAFVFCRVIICQIIYMFYKRQRPYQQYNFTPEASNWFSSLTTKATSFPSRHTLALASFSTIFFIFNPIIGILAFIVTILTGLARVMFGFHFISDVIFGLVIGFIGSLFVFVWIWPIILALY